jgi:hypothetical protein
VTEAKFLRDVCGALFAGAIAGLSTLTGMKIAACVQGVLAEQEQARALASRLVEAASELEAERIRRAASEPSDSVRTEIEKVLRDGGAKQ